MTDNKEMEDLLGDLGDLGDFSELGDLAEEDFEALLGEEPLSTENVSESFNSEFDGLMDLADFEELGSSDDMIGLDGLLDAESDKWSSNAGTLENKSSESIEKHVSGKEAMEADENRETVEMDLMLDNLDESGNLTFSEEERLKEKETEQKKVEFREPAESNDIGLENLIDLDAMPEENSEDVSFKESSDEVGDLLDIAGADLQKQPNLNSVEQVNDELLLDVPELDEKKERKAFKKTGVKAKETNKVSIWQKLFGNVPDENADKKAEYQAAKEAKKASKKTKEEIALEKQEKQKAKEEAAALKKAEQAEKKAQKEEQKKLKLAERAAAKEARELEEAKEPVTRINRVGAGIILVTFAVIGIVIIAGNNSYAYSQCIARASAYFSQREYTSAYNQIYGVEVKKSDEELKDQVMTVMFIEKQLNSFDNYFAMEMYPEALDSLLKGLDKYDRYLEQARSLGIESDVNYVKNKILSELKSAFNISEKQAYKLLSISNTKEYTGRVVEAANGN